MSSGNEAAQLLINGIGKLFRSDDAAGIVLARILRDRVPASVRIIEESGEGAALVEVLRDAPGVILVDAVHSGAAPGTLHRLDLQAQGFLRKFCRYSTHAMAQPKPLSSRAHWIASLLA